MAGFALALRDLMGGQGWTIRALARQVPMDAGHLSRILSGQRQANERLARRCDDLLGSGDLLRSLIVPADDVGPATAGAGVKGAAAARQVTRRLTADTAHPVAVEGLEESVAWLARAYVSLPVDDVVGELSAVQAMAVSQLGVPHPVSQTRRLYVAACRTSGLLAHVALDGGDYPTADARAPLAGVLACYAEDPALLAWVRGLQSLIAYWDGRVHQAAELAADGLMQCPAGGDAVRLQALRARALAGAADVAAGLQALELAEQAHEQDERQDDGDGEPLGGVFAFDPAKRLAYAGTTLLATGRAEALPQAIKASTRALAAYQRGPDQDRSSGDIQAAHLDLATAHTRAGDLDVAHLHLAVVAQVPPLHRTASIRRRLHRFTRELAATPAARSGAGRQLADTARAALTSGGPRTSDDPAAS